MSRTEDSIQEFLAQRAIAVVGVTRAEASVANGIFRRFKQAGYHVFPVGPHRESLDGERCYANLGEIGEPVDGVVVVTRPEVTVQVVDECIALGIPRVWMHNMLGSRVRVGKGLASRMTSTSDEAVRKGRDVGLTVIAGDCPMQHVEPVDGFHRCIHWFAGKVGNRD